jgi:spore coat protein JB
MKQNRETLLKRVYETGFAVYDIVLYLDTHPSCEKGLAYYRDVVQQNQQAIADYEAAYGPLTKKASNCPDYFDWVNNPWPWEGGCD